MMIALLISMFWNTQGNVPLDPNSQDYKGKLQRPSNWDANSILIPGFDSLRMKADTDIIYVAFSNPRENPCYFQYTVVLDKTEAVSYTHLDVYKRQPLHRGIFTDCLEETAAERQPYLIV